MAHSNSQKIEVRFKKLKRINKKDQDFDLVEHEILKFAYIFNEIINNSEGEKEIEDVDNTDGISDILNIIRDRLIVLIHSDIETINNPEIKRSIKILKSLVEFFGIFKD